MSLGDRWSDHDTHIKSCPTQQQYNLGRLRFNRRGASTPLWRVEASSPPSRQHNQSQEKQLNSGADAGKQEEKNIQGKEKKKKEEKKRKGLKGVTSRDGPKN